MLVKPPASDVNFVYALALFVFFAYHITGARRRGVFTHLKQLLKGHVAILAPVNIIEEIAKPVSLSLRLFGNMFAGGIMISLIALFPAYILWAPNAIWKLFDVFIGLIQAFIFALLTILYFSQATELEEDTTDLRGIRPRRDEATGPTTEFDQNLDRAIPEKEVKEWIPTQSSPPARSSAVASSWPAARSVPVSVTVWPVAS